MKFGVCAKPEFLETVKNAGADYIECTVVGLNDLTDSQLEDFSLRLKANNIKCESLAVLFPGTLPLVGNDADICKVREYLSVAFERVSVFNPEIIVFGSGKARRCPDGFERERAYEQLIEVSGEIAEAAQRYNITIVLEPLNKLETNMINTVTDAAELVKIVNRPNFKLLADFYHMLMDDEPADDILECGDMLAHVHIATKTTRLCPQEADRDSFKEYFNALRKINYKGRMSIEARIDDMEKQLPEAFKMFRSIF